jgi:glycosyltransferase involved in cell wall biosynthesis
MQSEIFAVERADDANGTVLSMSRFRGNGRDGTALMYQLATGSPLAAWLRDRSEPTFVNYHNVTPARFFDAWSCETAAGLAAGRAQLESLARTAVAGIAVSAYNEAERVEAGYRATAVAPVLIDLEALSAHAADDAGDVEARVGLRVLFVGRVTPNKAQHDLIKALAVYRRLYDPRARLHLVGGVAAPRYQTALEGFVAALGLEEAVTLTGAVPAGVLAAHYRNADVFVCLSEHEGFCVPLLEAMHHGLPVIAYAAAAVPETLAGAGVLLTDKSPATVAAAIHAVVSNAGVRDALVAAGRTRLEDFTLARTRARYVELFTDLLR